MILKLPIYFHTDATRRLEEADIDYDTDQCQLKDMIFYTISYLSIYEENGKVYTKIGSNGEFFICPLSRVEVEQLINKALRYEVVPN